MKARYLNNSAPWLKGGTHIHSRASDGGLNFAQLEELYLSLDFDFLFRTDHWICSDVDANKHRSQIIWLDGVELDAHDAAGAYYHVVGLGRFTGLDRSLPLSENMQTIRNQGGLLVLAHPQWSGNTTEDALRWDFDAVEVYNHHARWLNGKSDGISHWNTCMDHRTDTLAIACDDAHIRPEYPTYNGGWICVRSARNAGNIMQAIKAGEYYSSTGPEFIDICVAEDLSSVEVKCKPVKSIRIVGPGPAGGRKFADKGDLVCNAKFALPVEWPWIYIEIEDARGKRAWTNSLIIPDDA